MRAAIAQRVETAVDVERPDRPASDIGDQPPSGWDIPLPAPRHVGSWMDSSMLRRTCHNVSF